MWQTGRVHVQGRAAGNLALLLNTYTETSPRMSHHPQEHLSRTWKSELYLLAPILQVIRLFLSMPLVGFSPAILLSVQVPTFGPHTRGGFTFQGPGQRLFATFSFFFCWSCSLFYLATSLFFWDDTSQRPWPSALGTHLTRALRQRSGGQRAVGLGAPCDMKMGP